MKFLGIPRPTAEWFINHRDYLDSLTEELPYITSESALSEGVIAVGPLRITAHANQVITIWNNEYLTGTDYEDWGFIKLTGPLGLLEVPALRGNVLEGALFVINQRLQSLYLPEGWNYRPRMSNVFTCKAGRGEAWHYSLGCYDSKVQTSKGSLHSIVCVGPSNLQGFDVIEKQTLDAGNLLPRLLEVSNQLLVKVKSRPVLDTPKFKSLKDQLTSDILKKGGHELPVQSVPELGANLITDESKFSTLAFTYEDWTGTNSPLSDEQREILESDILLKQPLRIIGAAGTGKSLLMQLLAIRRLLDAKEKGLSLKILYVVHNTEMISTVTEKFRTLGGTEFLREDNEQRLYITTLFEHSCTELKIDRNAIIDKDAQQTKLAQRYIVQECIDTVFNKNQFWILNSELFKKVQHNQDLGDAFADLVVSEIGVAIKGRSLSSDKKQYVEADRPLTRFHGILNNEERGVIFEIFENYKKWFDDSGMLDADDVAITFMGHLRTPLWEMRRKKEGFDFVFVDEVQLFNQNERMLFKFLAKKSIGGHLPIALALDEAQEIRGATSAGFGLLGIEDIFNETLPRVYRCTPAILNLAFYIISRTTDLFGPDFPDFTQSTATIVADDDYRAEKPKIIVNAATGSFVKSILKEIRNLRKHNTVQIAVVIHAERYYQEILSFLKKEDLPVIEASKRGELLDPKKPIVYVTRPELIGGQEFDAVICVGLEHGIVPPIIVGHPGLSETLEQQSLREMYLAFTRARYKLLILNSKNSSPTSILQQAIQEELVEVQSSNEAV